MSDIGAGGQAPPTPPGPGAPPPPPAPPPVVDPPEPGAPDEGLTPEAAKQIATLRQEAAANRKRAVDAEAALKVKTDAELSDQQRATQERDEAKAEADKLRSDLNAEKIRTALVTAAVAAKSQDPDAVVALLQGQVQIGEDGKPVGVTEAVAALLVAKPWLVTTGAPAPTIPPIGAGNPPKQPPADGQLTREDLKSMTPTQIEDARIAGRLENLTNPKT